jgi:polyphosphate glucokinase
MTFGVGKGHRGVVFMITLGTGIGSAIFVNGSLLPNTELGHIEMSGMEDIEPYISDLTRKKEKLSWHEWAARVNEYLNLLEALFSPDLFILSGGVSKKHQKYLPLLHTQAQIVPAQLLNEAGIVGAALAAKGLR